MNQVRTFLLFAWLLVGFLLWEAWQRDYALPPAPAEVSAAAPIPQDDGALPPVEAIPDSPLSSPVAPRQAEPAPETEAHTVTLESDVLRLRIDTRGASVVEAELLAYGQRATPDAAPVRLLDSGSQYFTAQSGWVSQQGEAPTHQSLFVAEREHYRLAEGEDSIAALLVWHGSDGLRLERSLRLRKGAYAVEVTDRVINASAETWRGSRYHQLLRVPPPAPKSSFTNPEAYSFVGAAWYSSADRFKKIPFDDFDPRSPLNVQASQGWIGMLQHYFFAAWIPPTEQTTQLSTGVVSGRYLIRSVSPLLQVDAGTEQTVSARLYVGPKLQEQLADLAPGLELAVDYGIFTVIAEPLFWLLSLFHTLTGNWGWAIILLVVLIKLVFFKLSETQYKSFARMRQVQPRIEALKERYGDDRQKFNMAMMELYKKEKINPMGGCLPILVQIPVFISLYWVLLESVELRHAAWMGWIQNLNAPDPYFILPALNLLSMWLTQKLSPTPGMDPLQKKMMQAMPLVFGVLFAFFPAGLVLYWTVNGALGLLQQWVITKRHGQPAKA
jgi:YidC/Oxa1 family membrane protein insertase